MSTSTLFLILLASNGVATQAAVSQANASPVRKVVTMLQAMSSKVEAEGAKEKKNFEDFECYCKAGAGDMEQHIAEAKVKIPQLKTDIAGAVAEKAQLEADLKQHEEDRAAAITAVDEAKKLRAKEHDDFKTQEDTLEGRIEVMGKAISAIKSHTASAFLQSKGANVIKNLVQNMNFELYESDKEDVLSFLSASSDSDSPQSDEISGILSQMKEEMSKSLKELVEDEKQTAKESAALVASKQAEIAAAVKAIQEKTMRKGGLAVDIEEMKKDLADTQISLEEDSQFIANFAQNCAKKQKEYSEAEAIRQQELTALADTVQMLDSDESKDLLHSTLAGTSLLEVDAAQKHAQQRALELIEKARDINGPNKAHIDFIAMALHGKKKGFLVVMDLIDKMVKNIAQDQDRDYAKRDECKDNLDAGKSDKKAFEREIANTDAMIGESKSVIGKIQAEIDAELKRIAFMDKEVAQATEIRKQEHQTYLDKMASDSAAKELLEFAKNRLYKFYQPSMYKKPEEAEATSFVQISAHQQTQSRRDRPTIDARDFDYSVQKDDSTGVIGLLDKIIHDLVIEMHESETTENNAQVDYQETMQDAAKGRKLDMEAVTAKKGAKADAEMELEDIKNAKSEKERGMRANDDLIASYHQDCDFLLDYFDHRKQAREDEVDALKKAKAVLAGSDEDMEDQ